MPSTRIELSGWAGAVVGVADDSKGAAGGFSLSIQKQK
jgi:hypothetical protein